MNARPRRDVRPLPDSGDADAERAVRRVADAILRAVDAGVPVALVRVSRHHDGRGKGGDQRVPTIREARPAVTVPPHGPA